MEVVVDIFSRSWAGEMEQRTTDRSRSSTQVQIRFISISILRLYEYT